MTCMTTLWTFYSWLWIIIMNIKSSGKYTTVRLSESYMGGRCRRSLFGITRLCWVMQNSDPEGLNFYLHRTVMFDSFRIRIVYCWNAVTTITHQEFFFLHIVHFWMFYFESRIHYHSQWHWRSTFLNLMSSWNCNDVNLTTKLHDVL